MANDENKPETTTSSSASSAPQPQRGGPAATKPSSASSPMPPPPAPAGASAGDSSVKEEEPGDDGARRNAALEAKRKTRAETEEKAKAEFEKSLVDFLYLGPKTSFSFGNGHEVQLHPGKVVKLPKGSKYAERLLDRGYATDDAKRIAAALAAETAHINLAPESAEKKTES